MDTAWQEHIDCSPTVTGNQQEQQKSLLAWFYDKLTVLEHVQLSKCPHNLAYYCSNRDKPQVRPCRGNRAAARERSDRTPVIAYKTAASPVCQHHYKGNPLILLVLSCQSLSNVVFSSHN